MKESMVIYESAYKAIGYLPDEKSQLEALKGLLEYGFYDTIPESDNPLINMIFVQAIPSMRSAKERYELSVENGKKGGRPAAVPTEDIVRLKQNGMTNKQIAEQLGCSEKNIEKRISTYNKTNPTNPTNPPTNPTLQDGRVYPTNPTNLSVSVSYTDTVSESVSSTDNGTIDASSQITADNTCPEEKDTVIATEPVTSPPEKVFVSGDGLPGRRIRDLSAAEAKEIKAKLKQNVPYLDIEREYGMRHGVITSKFDENWKAFIWAKVNGRV